MKILSMLPLLFAPLAIAAGPYDSAPGGNPMMGMDMQKMQQMAMEMQTCMQNLDMEALKKLQHRGEAMETEIRSMCDNGQRDAAMNKAMAYAKEISNNPELRKLGKCSESVRTMMPTTQIAERYSEDKIKNRHICDELK